MRLLWEVARRSFRRWSTYRMATAAGVFTNTAFGYLRAYILVAVAAAGGGVVGGWDEATLVTFSFLTQGLIACTGAFRESELAERVRTGDVVVDLYRPIDLQAWWLASWTGRAAFTFLARGVPPVLLGAVVFDLVWPAGPAAWAAFAVSVVLASGIGFGLRFCTNLTAFWLLDNRGLDQLVTLVLTFFGGLLIPVVLFPTWLESLARACRSPPWPSSRPSCSWAAPPPRACSPGRPDGWWRCSSPAGCCSGPRPARWWSRVADGRDLLATYRRLVGAKIRSDWQYRTSFVLFLVSQTVITALDLAVILVIFDVVPSIGGWSVGEVAVLYGLTSLSFGLGDLLVSQIESVAEYVRQGTFDRLLLRPVPTVLQLSASEFALRRLGRSVPGAATLVVALAAADIDWTVDRVVLVPVTVLSGTVIFGAVWVATASISFWAVGAREVANSFTYGGGFAHQYPLHVYARWVRTVLGWIVPMAFVAYVPAVRLLDAANPLGLPGWLAAAPPFVAMAAAGVARLVWSAGIRAYQSTGS